MDRTPEKIPNKTLVPFIELLRNPWKSLRFQVLKTTAHVSLCSSFHCTNIQNTSDNQCLRCHKDICQQVSELSDNLLGATEIKGILRTGTACSTG
jgi:uncharacterized paraquat-inducible protein A